MLNGQNWSPVVVTTDSGLRYLVLKPGSGGTPSNGSKIKAHYTGKFIDGRVFDSSVKSGTPIEFVTFQKAPLLSILFQEGKASAQ